MAYVSLLSVTQSLEQILHPRDQSLVLHETEQPITRSLHEKASFLLSFLEVDALKYGEASLESKIRDAAYEMEAMIESGFPHHNFEGSQKMVDELDSILEEVVKLKEMNQQVEDIPPTKSNLSTTSSKSGSSDKKYIVGLREETMEIKYRLTGLPSSREIISVVGMPGIGKTTLAKTLYEDPVIMRRFDVCAWITVSADYNSEKMLNGLLDSLKNNNQGSDSADRLYKTLKMRRYLIVMDDVWDTKAWDQVKRVLPDDNNGSRVIVTTRLQEVAEHVECPESIYHPGLLSPNDSWKLLCKIVFNEEPCPCEFEDVGKEIANNCKGLPLSLAVIGGILYKADRRLDYWRHVGRNLGHVLNNADNHQVMDILSLSYKHLPHHLKACFLYMSVCGEDESIRRSRLIKMWIAEGFIKPDPSKSLEEVACESFENLIDRNMIFVSGLNDSGGIRYCGVHDLMRDLCMRIAEEEKFLKVVNLDAEISRDCTYNFRHVYIYSKEFDYSAGIYGSHLDSVVHFPTKRQNSDLLSSKLSCQLSVSCQLRVLETYGNLFSVSEDEIPYLDGSRYIYQFSEINCEIPSYISKLSNLQTLIIPSMGPGILPFEIWMMPQLRHIVVDECFLPHPSDVENGKNLVPLENLQTFKGVTNFRFSEDAIQMMPNVKKLWIQFKLDRSDDLPSYCIGNLILLRQLEVLRLAINISTEYPLPNISLPPTLKKLKLYGFRLSPKHMASIGSLQHLETLALSGISFDDSQWEPTEGEFLKLKSLYMSDTNLEYLKADETNFPILRSLSFVSCTKLVEIPFEIGYIQTLQLIHVALCTDSATESVQLIQKEQQDLGNDTLQFRYYEE